MRSDETAPSGSKGAPVWLGWLALVLTVTLGGCFLAPWSPGRPDPAAPVSGPVPYVEGCQGCHASPVAAAYAQSLHAAKGIQCGQCHTPGGHPDFARPVSDAKCGGCHQPQYRQSLLSRHFATRQAGALDHDRAARVALRRAGFTAPAPDGRHFVGDGSSGDLGGRLCVACHYDEHRLGLATVRRAEFCTGCHADRADHFPDPTPGTPNRCIQCHVRVGETESGQVVDTHRFAMPGTEEAEP
jgi:hypothetical protein